MSFVSLESHNYSCRPLLSVPYCYPVFICYGWLHQQLSPRGILGKGAVHRRISRMSGIKIVLCNYLLVLRARMCALKCCTAVYRINST